MNAAAGKSRLAALIVAFSLAACTAPGPQQMPTTASAAEYCGTQAGTRTVERGPFGEIGVCVFEGNRQCEEWALLLGRCPRGGIPVGGYATTSERHCAIRGGRMTIPGCALSPVGLYETTLPAPSGGAGRSVTLVLDAGRVAMLSRALPGGTSQLVPGRWESSGDIVTVTTENERLVFEHKSDRLIARDWDRAIWGASGPGTLLLRN
jgi:putative hemolysin